MSKELIKELIASTVDGDYYSFANATSQLVESKMKVQLSETVADIKASLFEKKKKDDEYEEDYGIGDKLDVKQEGNTAADQNFNNDQQQQALTHVGQITFAESDETGGPEAAKKRIKNSSVDVSLGKDGPDETSSSDQKAKFNSDSEDPDSTISPKDKKNKGSVKIKAAGKDTAGTDVISDSVEKGPAVKGSETAVNPEDDTYDDSGYDVHEDDEDKYEDDDDDNKSRSAKEVEKDADDEEEEESEDKIDRKEKMKDKMRYSDDEKDKDKEEAAEYEEAHADDYDYEDEMDYKEDEEEDEKDESQDYGPDSTSDSRRKSREREANAAKSYSDNKRSRDMMKHHPKPMFNK